MYLCYVFPILQMGFLIGLSYLPEKKLSAMAEYIGQNLYIKPRYIVSLPEYTGGFRGRTQRQVENEKNLKSNQSNGNLSVKSQRKLKNAVNWLVSSAKEKYLWSHKHKKAFRFKINFITLTFPYDQAVPVTEKQAKRCTHAFLAYARKYFYLRNYIWKFEQTKAGQLHIHLTTDTFIDYRKIRRSWNYILDREALLDKYKEKYGNNNPNSTDVHAVMKVKDIAAYISKYMSKSEKEMTGYKGRIWACNREISEANSCQVFIDRSSSDRGIRQLYDPSTEYRPIMGLPNSLGQQKEIGQLFFMDERMWSKLKRSVIKETYDNHRFHIRNNIEKMPDEYWHSFVNDYFDGRLKEEVLPTANAQGQPPVRTIPKNDRGKRPIGGYECASTVPEILFEYA